MLCPQQGQGRFVVKAKFISADGLTLETTIPYPPLPRIRRPLMNKRLTLIPVENPDISVETVIQTRNYEFTGIRDNIAIYEEMI